MRAPSLRRRVISGGILVVLVTLILTNAIVYAALRRQLTDDARGRVEERTALAGALVDDLTPQQIVERLGSSGVPARAVLPGEDLETQAYVELRDGRVLRESVELPEVGHVEVVASLAAVDDTLRDFLLLGGLATVFGTSLAALVLIRVSRHALAPLEIVVTTARAIARGHTGERLRPDRSDTEIGRLAEAFDEMLDAEEAALAQAQTSSRLNQQFLADAAHQLRTPIAGIQASAELLSLDGKAADRERLLTNLVRSTKRASLLVGSLLRMAGLDQGAPVEPQLADLHQICRDEVERVRSASDELAVAVSSDGGCYDAVPVDAPSIREAVANVLDNATRHARSRVEVHLRTDGGSVVIAVTDDGPGMDDATAQRAFERFATFGAGHGAGLGLPIARGIAEAHGGELVYEGGSFLFRLPVLRPDGR